jgi:putative PIN family toxin of toxin-antitoxin system
MRTPDRIVIDTNVFVSAIALPLSVPRQVVDRALAATVLFSEATMSELTEVLYRPKFDDYVSMEERTLFLRQLSVTAEFVSIIQQVRECRDPKDDMFLEVALNGRADLIITGDNDLLALNPWRGIEVLTPAEYPKR